MKTGVFILCTFAMIQICGAGELTNTIASLRENGAFGFPQKEAKVLCDQPTLRFSVWNNDKYLFAQAVLWTVHGASWHKDKYNRETGDWSVLMLDVNADRKVTPNVDREYVLGQTPGLSYVIEHRWRYQTGLYNSNGRGAIRYVNSADGKPVRVDTYLIPLREISRHVGEKLRLAYWGFLPNSHGSPLMVNSTSFTCAGKNYNRWAIPLSQYDEYVLTRGGDIDLAQVPAEDLSKEVPMPKVGQIAPEISAKEWINTPRPLTLAGLRGKVVVVDFWATWCGPCVECIPHFNELQRKYSGKNIQLLSLVREGHQTMDPFLAKHHVDYPIGLESSSLDDYGITGIPHAFVIDQTGQILWSGDPDASPSEMDKVIAKALGR